MPEVKPLAVLQPVVDDSDGGHVVHHLSRLTVEQVVTAVEAPVPAANRKQHKRRFIYIIYSRDQIHV